MMIMMIIMIIVVIMDSSMNHSGIERMMMIVGIEEEDTGQYEA